MRPLFALLATLLTLHAAPPFKDTPWPHWAALEARFGRIPAQQAYVISIPSNWNGALTTPGQTFWLYLRARFGSHVTLHFNRGQGITTYRVYGNAWGSLWVLHAIYNALPSGIASIVFGAFSGHPPTLPSLPQGVP